MTLTTKLIRGLRDPIWPFSFAAFILPLMFAVVLVVSSLEGEISLSPSPLTIILGFAAGILALCLAVFRRSLPRIRLRRTTVSRSGSLIINVNKHDLAAIATGMPGYVFFGLTYCVKEVFIDPTVVFAGAPSGSLRDGLVFCGKPAHSYNNKGIQLDPPSDMIYMAYVNRSGFLFDWNWAPEDPEIPGYPVGWQARFNHPLPQPPKATLELPKNLHPSAFDPNNAWYSKEGDCIFWYSSNDPAFAERVNDDLTLFISLSDRKTTVGAKLKNIQRILGMRKISLEQLQTKPLVVIIAESLAYQAEKGQLTSHYDELIGQIQRHPPRARVA
jgi:hypothetical protein